MSEKEKKKQIAKISIFITSIFVIFLSITYAFINLTLFGAKRQVITVGDLKLDLKEKDELTISNALPMYDDVGLIQEKGFKFDLINEGDKKTGYVLKLEEIEKEGVTEENKLSESIVRYGLIKGKDTTVDYISSIKGKDYAIDEGEINGKETISYELKLWIDYKVKDNSLIKDKSLSYRVKVEATQEITRAKFTVNFDTKDSSIEVYEGLTYDKLPTPQKEGYEFLGWYTEPSGGGDLIQKDSEVILKNLTLYAKWNIICKADTIESDESGANAPSVANGMIPVVYASNCKMWVKADQENGWYDYNKQNWANAVTVKAEGQDTREFYQKAEAGTPIPMSDINTMWVWIPRYSYTIKSQYGKGESASQTTPGEIDVKFVDTTENGEGAGTYTDENNIDTTWKIHPAFQFGNTKLSGIWVGKFELAGTLGSTCTNANCDISTLMIKPNVTSLGNQTISSFFYAIKSMQKKDNPFGFETDQSKMDVHMIKNSEWGVAAYLSQSKYGKYGNSVYEATEKEVRINNCSTKTTGIGASSQSETVSDTTCNALENQYNGIHGQAASTTGNITGVYDMSGGAWEYVMGALSDGQEPAKPTIEYSGFIVNGETSQIPDAKYYDLYTTATSKTACSDGICYGHALSETSGWYNDYANFVLSSNPWFMRGGHYKDTSGAGAFSFSYCVGSAYSNNSSRAVLVALGTTS